VTTTRTSTCTITAHATVAARADAIGLLREATPPTGGRALPARFLRHADEHTVVGIRAVQEAMARLSAPADQDGPGSFDRFAVVAATCAAGRPASARTLVQYGEGGAVTVSPHVVPQCSLHATASAVSVGLGMHGPTIGVGGGPEAFGEGVLAALSILAEPGVAGCWLVLTAWDEEPGLDDRGDVPGDATCRAVALALDRAATGGVRLSLGTAPGLAGVVRAVGAAGTLTEFAARLDPRPPDAAEDAAPRWSLRLDWGAMVTLEVDAVAAHCGRARRAAA
jgi:hypothetical protein